MSQPVDFSTYVERGANGTLDFMEVCAVFPDGDAPNQFVKIPETGKWVGSDIDEDDEIVEVEFATAAEAFDFEVKRWSMNPDDYPDARAIATNADR